MKFRVLCSAMLLGLMFVLSATHATAQEPCVNRFPTALNTRSTLCDAADGAITTLSTSITTGTMTLTVNSTGKFTATGTLAIDSEQMIYTAKTSTTFTISLRGAHGTAIVAHAAGTSVRGPLVAQHIKVQSDAQDAVEAKIGIGASTPSGTNKALMSNGTGISGWRILVDSDIPKTLTSMVSITFAADDPYDAATWNGSLAGPTKNAIRDKFETLGSGTTINATDGTIPFRSSATTFADSILTRVNANMIRVWDITPTTGSTLFSVRAGAGQSGNIFQLADNAGTPRVWFDLNGYSFQVGNINLSGATGSITVTSGSDIRADSFAAFTISNPSLRWPGTADLGFDRSANGVAEINNGTIGVWRDLKLRNLIATTAITLNSDPTTSIQVVRNSAQFDKTNTTLANVTGLSVNVQAAGVYSFRANLRTALDAGFGRVAIGGTATATAITASVLGLDEATTSTSTVANISVLGVPISLAGGSEDYVTIDGTIVVNAAGTLTVQFAQSVTDPTPSSVMANGTFEVKRIN